MTTVPDLSGIQSWQYYIGRDTTVDVALDQIRQSSAQLVVFTLGGPFNIADFYTGPTDPLRSKLILGYVDATEANGVDYYQRQFLQDPLHPPDWLGNALTPFPNAYAARYWLPSWQAVIFHEIDVQIAGGC